MSEPKTNGAVAQDVPAADTTSSMREGDAAAATRSRPGARRRWGAAVVRLLLVVAFLCLWQVASGRWVDDFFISRPTEIWDVWIGWVVDGTLWDNASSTFLSASVGFVIGGVAAVLVGYVLGGSPRLADVFEPFITSIYSLPKLALVPLFVLWFGVGRTLQLAICALVVFFLMFYNTFYGIRDVDRDLIDSVRIMGGTRRDLAFRVRLPSALVWVVAGLKLSVPQALVAVVVAEILASNRGLGHLVSVNSGQFNTAGTFAALFTLLLIGIVLDRVLGLLTRRSLVWKQDSGAPR